MTRRILFVHHAIGLGGAPTSLSTLIANLGTEYESVVVMPDRPGSKSDQLFEEAGAVVDRRQHIRPFNGVVSVAASLKSEKLYAVAGMIPCLLSVMGAIRRWKPDVVHVNTAVLPAAAFAARLLGIPCIIHIRETAIETLWGRLLVRLNQMSGAAFVGIDHSGLRSFKISNDNGTVVRNAVASSSSPDFSPPQTGEITSVLTLCRLTSSNGILEFLASVKEIELELDNRFRFVVAGHQEPPTPYEVECIELASEIACVDVVEFQRDPLSMLVACDVVVAPFTEAHSARMVLEAAALGKVAVVSDLPNLRELVKEGEAGVIFDIHDPLSLLGALNLARDDDYRLELGRAAFRFFNDEFTVEASVAGVKAVYDGLLGCGSPENNAK